MSNKKIKALRDLSRDELMNRLRTSEAEFFQVKLKAATGQLEDKSTSWRLRKEVARIKTLLSQKSESVR